MNGCCVLYIPCLVGMWICMAHVHKNSFSIYHSKMSYYSTHNEVIIPALQALQYIHNICTKSPPTYIDTPWEPLAGSLCSGESSAFRMVCCVHHSHTLAHVLKISKHKSSHP